ncbi:MAG: O-antigen ligase family protein [Bacteroidia bacterium]|nr:O-antigen ligase family protein [Bacteroidia bacterium]
MQHIQPQQLLVFGICILVSGLTLSPAMISIGTGIAGVAGLWSILKNRATNSVHLLCSLPAAPIFWLFIQQVLSIWNTENLTGVIFQVCDKTGCITKDSIGLDGELRIKLPLLLLAFAGWGNFRLTSQQWIWINSTFLSAVSISCVLTLINYFRHYEAINAYILQSKEVPIKPHMSHIYFSMIAAFATFVAGNLSWLFYHSKRIVLSSAYALVCGLIFYTLHIVSARTGLLAFYLAAGLTLLIWVFRQKKYLVGISAISLLIITPVILWKTMPTIQNRIQNTVEDVRTFEKGKDISWKSVSQRFAAWITAWHLIQKYPITGVGNADMEQEMMRQYDTEDFILCKECRVYIHNQYIETAVSFGIPGLIWFLVALGSPLGIKQPRTYLFWAFWAVACASMMTESILERQVGVSFFSVFWILTQLKRENITTNNPAG